MTLKPKAMPEYLQKFSVALSVCLSASLFCPSASADDEHDAPLGEKQETELRIGLTEAGFNQLLRRWSDSAQSSRRTDLYFDALEDGQFQMRHYEPRAKLRIQIREAELVVQKSWIDEQQTFDFSGFIWSATTRSSAVGKFSQKSSTNDRVGISIQTLTALAHANKAHEEDLRSQENLWSSQAWPKLETFDEGTSQIHGPLVPAAVVLKERWLIQNTLADGRTYKLQLGRDSDVLGSGQPTNFEIEVEFKNSSVDNEKNAVESLTQWLIGQGIRKDQTISQKGYDFFQHLENLFARAGD